MEKYIILRGFLFLAVFLVLHRLYHWSPNLLTQIFCGTDETFIEHAKLGAWAATFLALGEYLFRRLAGSPDPALAGGSYLIAQGLAVTFLPWMMFVFWYPVPTWVGKLPSVAWEIGYSIIVTGWLGILLGILGVEFSGFAFSRLVQTLIIVLYVLTMLLLTTFSFRIPWAPFFGQGKPD
jgi:hypothetical protein